MSPLTEFGLPMVMPGRKGLRTITQLYWAQSALLRSGTVGSVASHATPVGLISPGQRHTSAIDQWLPPACTDLAPTPVSNFKYFNAFLVDQKIEKTNRNDGRTLISRTFEELSDGTVGNSLLLNDPSFTNSAYGGANNVKYPATVSLLTAGVWDTVSGIALSPVAFAGRTFQTVRPFRFPGVYNTNTTPMTREVTAIVMELFFLGTPPDAILGYAPLQWCMLTEQFFPIGGNASTINKYYQPFNLSGGYGLSATGVTYKGYQCSSVDLSSNSLPGGYPGGTDGTPATDARNYQLVESAKEFYGASGLIQVRRDIFVPFS